MSDKQKHLDAKKSELDEIMQETEKEEQLLIEQSEKFEGKIEDRLIKAYKRIRGNVKNGLAVVAVERRGCLWRFFLHDSTTSADGDCFSSKNHNR